MEGLNFARLQAATWGRTREVQLSSYVYRSPLQRVLPPQKVKVKLDFFSSKIADLWLIQID